MKTKHRAYTLSIVLFVALLASLAPKAHAATCSSASVAGNWEAATGTLILPTGPVPVAAVIRATLYMDGTLTGTEARSFGGDYAEETASGTWAVNSECMGTITVNFFGAGKSVRTSVVTILFDDNTLPEVRNYR